MTEDYTPLSLAPFLNAGLEVYGDPDVDISARLYAAQDEIPVGRQDFHGLPFQIGAPGAESGPYFVAFGKEDGLYADAVTIPVMARARIILFAHTLLETDLWKGGPLGRVIARYRFHLEGVEALEIPIRERFEVGTFPFAFGQKPFLCVSDTKNSLFDRYSGSWGQSGWRHTEARWGQPRGYFIWAWENPHPHREIQALEVVPGPHRFLIAAITLGSLDEYPLVKAARLPVRITLSRPEDSAPPFGLEIEVDRGVATYAYPLPALPLEESAPGFSGFGAPRNQLNSPAYAFVAAIPSATVRVRKDGQALGEAPWDQVKAEGAVETSRFRLEVIDPGRNWVHVSLVDDGTGQPLPCRVAFLSPEGVPYPPHGHHAPVFSGLDTWNNNVGGDVELGQISYAYVDGRCQGWLPRGRVLVDAACGYEYQPVRAWYTIEPGQQSLTVRLKRLEDMNAAHWFSGDTHVHFLSTLGSQLEARGEGLNVVNLLLSQWGHHFSNIEEFTGEPFVSADGRTIVYASQENRQHMLGHLSLLGLREPVWPLGSGGPSEAELGGGVDTSLSHWADQCHAQGGTVIIPHLGVTNGETAALIATGRADAAEMLFHSDYLHHEYYRYLNNGYRLPLTGGTDKMDAGVPVGLYRTYVYIPPEEPFTYDNWCRGLRQGRSFLSGGALLGFTVEGQPIGSTLKVQGGGSVEVEARARSVFPLHSLQIVQQGRVVAESETREGSHALHLRARLRVTGDTWLAARCAGPGYTAVSHFDSWKRGIMAHTSPIYITCSDEYELFDEAVTQYMLTAIEGSLAYIHHLSPQPDPETVTYPHGEADHLAYLERPFLQARRALHRRMHKMGIAHGGQQEDGEHS